MTKILSRPGGHRGRLVVIVAIIGLPLGVLLAGCGVLILAQRPAPPPLGEIEFVQPLPVPPLDEGRVEDGVRVFALTAATGTAAIVPQGDTATLGYNGDYLGPTLVATRGEDVRVDVRNDLDEPTTVHWHGMHLPAAMDGGPHSMIPAGASWHPEWSIDQPAATLWYHPHLHERTREQVDAGLAGMFLLRDDVESAIDLPRSYGVDDIPVIVQDRSFHADGAFAGGIGMQFDGVLGDTVLVNGVVAPYLDVTTELVRLRLLNGSSARMYDFAFVDGRTFDLIATDGGLLDAPVPSTGLPLSPGERAEILVALAPGETVTMISVAPDERLHAGSAAFDVLQLRAAASLAPSPVVPTSLATLPAADESGAATERSFVMSGHNINDVQMDMRRIDFVATVNTSEVWTVRSEAPLPHSFHVHDTRFRVLDVDGDAPPPRLAGWKDTIPLEEDRVYRLLLRFDDYSDPTTPYMYHCHLLWHEDQGMMGQFLVVEPGQSPALSRPEGDTDDHHNH